jgi:hypothetical protein
MLSSWHRFAKKRRQRLKVGANSESALKVLTLVSGTKDIGIA